MAHMMNLSVYGRYDNASAMRADILRMISGGQRGQKEIVWVMNARSVAPEAVLAALAEMLQDGHLTLLRAGRYAVTSEGRKLMPTPDLGFAHGQYKPPPVLRREGSDRASSLPSMAGGVLKGRHDE